jgi:hypothetical protein
MQTKIDITGERTTLHGLKFKDHDGLSLGRSRHGYSPVDVQCPYCQTNNATMLWSLSGSGKRCEGCFARLTARTTYRPTDKDLKRLRRDDPRRDLWRGL